MDPFTQITQHAISIITRAIQELDDQAWHLLTPHIHKIICFHIDHFNPLYFQVEAKGLKAYTPTELDHINLTFSGPLNGFISMIFTANRVNGQLHVKGDLECAKALYDSWHHIDLDWERQCAKVVGGDIAQGLSTGLTHCKDWLHQTWQARQEDLSAFLQDEKQLLPTVNEVQTLYDEIDSLRHQVERLEARLRLLNQRLNQN